MADDTRPVLIGMNNPYGSDGKYALYPAPVKSAGYRLFSMFADASDRRWPSGARPFRQTYVDGFDRRNVLGQAEWSMPAARAAGAEMLPTLAGRRAIIFGRKACQAMGLDHRAQWLERRELVMVPATGGRLVWWLAPHPSGMCREYNDPAMRQRVGDLMLDLFLGRDPL